MESPGTGTKDAGCTVGYRSGFQPPYNRPIRQASRLMNQQFGGTYMAYLVAEADEPDAATRPEVLRYLDELQREIGQDPRVGKTTSLADILRWINRVLTGNDELPRSRELAAQYLFLYLSSGGSPDLAPSSS